MDYCESCYTKIEGEAKFCERCKERIQSGELVHLDEKCTKCGLHWHGYYGPDAGLAHHTDFDCRSVQTRAINPDRPYGEHIPLKCSNCGKEGWFTKNIEYIGARSIFWRGEGGECSCDEKFLVPLLEPSSKVNKVVAMEPIVKRFEDLAENDSPN